MWWINKPCHGCNKTITAQDTDVRLGGGGHRPYCSGDCFRGIGRQPTEQERYEASSDCLDGDSF